MGSTSDFGRTAATSTGDRTRQQLLHTELVVVNDAVVCETALAGYRTGRGDFADYLTREQARAVEASEVLTFDRALKGESGFRLLAG